MNPTGKQSLYVSRCLARASAGIARCNAPCAKVRKARAASPQVAPPGEEAAKMVQPAALNTVPEILGVAERRARQRAVIAMGPGLRNTGRPHRPR